MLYCALANRNIVEIRDQWPVVPYRMPDGRKGTHTFDFWFRYSCGARRCIAVRTNERVESEFRGEPSLAAMLEAVSKTDLSRFADGYQIYTDHDVSEDDVHNARELLLSRKYCHEDDYHEALAYVAPIRGAVLFHDLLQGAKVPAYRRMALWSLIDGGILYPVEHGRIRDRSLMMVNHGLINAERRAA